VTDAECEHLSSDALVELGPEEVKRKIAAGEITISGNQNVKEVLNTYENHKLFKGKSSDDVLATLRKSPGYCCMWRATSAVWELT
jgi:hypothetical protein